ncbi:MAG: 4-phosphoerythronate dehydrogenase, partial [Bacteroidales bacterium]
HAIVEYIPGREIARRHLKNANALMVRTRTRCDKDLLDGTAVRYIATATIGHDHIDTEYCRSRGIRWTNAPGCNASSVAQYISSALAYIIGKSNASFEELTLGIIGAGRIGSRIEVMARIAGMTTLVNDPPRERTEKTGNFVSLDELLKRSDIITMHVPLNLQGEDKTFHLADRNFFGNMKPGAWFINTSRGKVHETSAVLEVLHAGHLSGAILDVWENEPDINLELLRIADIGTPHIAGYSLDGKANGTAMCVQAISRYFNLGMDGWKPKDIPAPQNPVIRINCKGMSKEKIFYHLALNSYNILEDSNRLRVSPEQFETFREQYPVRREAKAYQVNLEDCNEESRQLVKRLGFRF